MHTFGRTAHHLNVGLIAGLFALVVLAAPETAQAAKTVTISTASTTITEGDSDKKDVTINFTLGEGTLSHLDFIVQVVAASSTATDNTNRGRTSCSTPSDNADMCYITLFSEAYAPIDRGTNGSFKIGILGDTDDEGSGETLALRLVPAPGARSDGWTQNSNTLILTIQDDDTASSAPAAPTGLAASPGNAQVTLTWNNPNDESISSYHLNQKKGTGAWGGWNAIPNSGRDTVSHTVSSLDNDSEYSFRIAAVNGGGTSGGSNTVTATPMAPSVVVEPTAITLNEGGGDQYTVVLAGRPPTGVVRVKITSVAPGRDDRDVGALAFEPYNWNEPQTITQYAPVLDASGGYTFTLRHTVEAPGTNYADVEADDVTVTVVDTTATLTLATDPATVTEGTDISLTVTSNRTLTGTLPVKLTFTARSSSSFDAADLPGGLTQVLGANFGGTGSKTGTVTIPTNPDTSTSEGAEAYTVTLGDDSTYNGYKLGSDTTADGTLNDGASASPTTNAKGITVVPMSLTADEGAGAAFIVVLDAAPSANVTVTVTGASGDVTFTHQGQLADGSNYGKLTFTTSNWGEPQWVRVWVRDDADMVDDADVTLTLTATGGGYDAVAAATVTVTVTENDKTMSPGLELPARAQGLTAEAGDGAVTLTWQDPGDPTIHDWQVWFRRAGHQASGWLTIPGADYTTTRHTVRGLMNGKVYRFRVRAVNDAGPGERSQRVSARPQKSPTHGLQRGPAQPLIAIADAAAREGDELAFAVTLSTPSSYPVRVAWQPVWGGSYGTAQARVDFVHETGVAQFPPNTTHVTIRLKTLDDVHDEGRETFAVRLSDPDGGIIADGEATGTIINADPMPRAWLGRFGRTVAEGALDGIAARVAHTDDATRASGFQGTFGGGTPATSLGQLLAGSHFTYTRGEPTRGSLGFWGRGARTNFDGQAGAVKLDGKVTSALLGVDYARAHWLAGVAFAQSRSHGGYRGGAAGMAGGVEAALTTAIPYASWRPVSSLTLWGASGRGDGAITLTTGVGETLTTTIGWTMAAGGASGELWSFDRGGALALVSDALWTRTTAARTAGLTGTAADGGRWRLGLEGSRRFALPGDARITPTLELGVRHDRGDAEIGTGVELGGGLAWHDPRRGLELHLDGRTLLTHEDGAMKDRGLSASLAYDPRPNSALGLTFALRQDIGGAARGGLDALFDHDPLAQRLKRNQDTRWTIEAGYGLAAYRGRFVSAPQVSYGVAAGGRETGIGWRLVQVAGRPDLSVAIRAVQRAEAREPTDHRIAMEVHIHW